VSNPPLSSPPPVQNASAQLKECHRLLAAKSSTFTEIDAGTQTVLDILHETNTHKAYCLSFGITQEQLESTPETAATTAYGSYLIDTGLQGASLFSSFDKGRPVYGCCVSIGDSTKLLMALLACLLGYGEVGLWLKNEALKEGSWVVMENNPYKRWMDDYSGEHYQQAVRSGLGKSSLSLLSQKANIDWETR
jgi:hydroxymethylpyrimidine/phosphomethylpyrimidine kinase